MVKSKRRIERQLRRKTNNELVETIVYAKKKTHWLNIASILSSPKKRIMNLGELNKLTKEGDKVLFPGKILSDGELSKKIEIIALKASKRTEEKIFNSKSTFSKIIDEIKKNPEAKGIKVLE